MTVNEAIEILTGLKNSGRGNEKLMVDTGEGTVEAADIEDVSMDGVVIIMSLE